ncbi:MAG: hypothetical protein WD042_10715 [Phycisphaeraceae bacterium]
MAKERPKAAAAAAKSEGQAAAAGAPGAGAAKKKGIVRMAMVLGAVLLLEGGTVVVTMIFSGGPDKATAASVVTDQNAEANRPVELLLVKETFPNQRTGRTFLYDTEIYITVPARDSEKVKKQVESMKAALSTDIAVIFRRAEPAQLREPTLATLTRQVKQAVDERIGRDPDGKPTVQEALIRKCIEFKADG